MWLFSSVILFMGCPTPPDKAQTGGAPQNAQNPPPKATSMVATQVPRKHGHVPRWSPNRVKTPPMAMHRQMAQQHRRRRRRETRDNTDPKADAENPDAIPTPDIKRAGYAVQIQEPPPQMPNQHQ